MNLAITLSHIPVREFKIRICGCPITRNRAGGSKPIQILTCGGLPPFNLKLFHQLICKASDIFKSQLSASVRSPNHGEKHASSIFHGGFISHE